MPLVYDILEDLMRGRLRDSAYPQAYAPPDSSSILRYQDITVFIAGGVTYEESLSIYKLNVANPAVRIMLGGTCIHNFTSFLDELRAASTDYTRSGRRL